MTEEIRVFFTALMFYTRIPCPSWVDHSEDYIEKCSRYLPFMGFIVTLIAGGIFFGAIYILPINVAAILYLSASVLTTGAFHEDGFGDVCDGFGGGWTKEKILDIMKDSRVGVYGVVGLILLFLIKFAAIIAIVQESNSKYYLFVALLASQVLSRWVPITIMFTHEYSREDGTTKVKPVAKTLSKTNLIIASLFAVITCSLLGSLFALLIFIPLYLVKMYLAKYFQKWIGGYTGDCLGASQQVGEIVVLLSILVLWKFI
jgi:adenosylcobinamide-GDP ribazoletransferase